MLVVMEELIIRLYIGGSMKKGFIFFLCALLFSFSSYSFQNTCVSSKCHSDFQKFRVVHSPVEDDCETCHEKVGKHKFKLVYSNKNQLCKDCHDDRESGKYLHGALNMKECVFCHDPHGGNSKALLKTKRVDTTCYECHDRKSKENKFIHGPNVSGNCSICHDSHSSDSKFLLVAPQEQLCINCHTDKDFSDSGENMHSALEEGCTGCHNPHASPYKYQLIASEKKICAECHQDVVEKSEKALEKHPPVKEGKGCVNCHDAHGSPFENNLKDKEANLCLSCHNKPIIGTDGKDYNIYKILAENPIKHGPINDGNCTGCHNPHGSDFYKILIASYPKKFYTPYEKKKYSLCFECHESNITEYKETTTDTNFRNGSENLHYVHVHRKKGRTCRACHMVHASKLLKHIREETPFGKWDIPINFEITPTGGSCAPGCHREYKYDRVKPEKYQ